MHVFDNKIQSTLIEVSCNFIFGAFYVGQFLCMLIVVSLQQDFMTDFCV